MKKSDILDLILKTFGIYLFVMLIQFYVNYPSYTINIFEQGNGSFVTLWIVLLANVVTLFFAWLFVFKSRRIVQKFIKEDPEFNFSLEELNYNKLLSIILTTMGLYIVLFRFPNFAVTVYNFGNYVLSKTSKPYLFLERDVAMFVQYVLGFILLANSQAIANWLSKYGGSSESEK